MGDPNVTLALLKAEVTCKECGAIRDNTPSGSVCPNGHGKIQPPVKEKYLRRYLERMKKAGKPNV